VTRWRAADIKPSNLDRNVYVSGALT